MGETGCGKTTLIRFMCAVREGRVDDKTLEKSERQVDDKTLEKRKKAKNMILVKVCGPAKYIFLINPFIITGTRFLRSVLRFTREMRRKIVNNACAMRNLITYFY